MARQPDFLIRELLLFGKVGTTGIFDLAVPGLGLVSCNTPGIVDLCSLFDLRGSAPVAAHQTPAWLKPKVQHIHAAAQRQSPKAVGVATPYSLPVALANPPLLTDNDYAGAAKTLGCEVAAIKAVASVESRGNGFLPDGRPKILFEAHLFGKFTKHKYDKSHPTISAPNWDTGKKYYSGSKHPEREYNRLQLAIALDHVAALKSASWGKFQVLGFNYAVTGAKTVDAFVQAMYTSEGNQLNAFVKFVQANKLDRYIGEKNWVKFAAGYNGPGYAKNHYDTKMAEGYAANGGLAAGNPV